MVVYLCMSLKPPHTLLTKTFPKVRDRQSSASLGLPSRIRDEDCDVQMLSPEDLEDEEPEGSASDIFGTNEPGHILYPLEMAKLAKLRMRYVFCSLRRPTN